mgnify:CR=1 FL=1
MVEAAKKLTNVGSWITGVEAMQKVQWAARRPAGQNFCTCMRSLRDLACAQHAECVAALAAALDLCCLHMFSSLAASCTDPFTVPGRSIHAVESLTSNKLCQPVLTQACPTAAHVHTANCMGGVSVVQLHFYKQASAIESRKVCCRLSHSMRQLQAVASF